MFAIKKNVDILESTEADLDRPLQLFQIDLIMKVTQPEYSREIEVVSNNAIV